MTEKRLFKRVKFESISQIEIGDKSYEGELVDISLRGALIVASQELPLKGKDMVVLKIYLPQSDIILTFDVELAHMKENHYGFKFLHEDIDTITHLRRLLELNLGDDTEIGQEITYWLKK